MVPSLGFRSKYPVHLGDHTWSTGPGLAIIFTSFLECFWQHRLDVHPPESDHHSVVYPGGFTTKATALFHCPYSFHPEDFLEGEEVAPTHSFSLEQAWAGAVDQHLS